MAQRLEHSLGSWPQLHLPLRLAAPGHSFLLSKSGGDVTGPASQTRGEEKASWHTRSARDHPAHSRHCVCPSECAPRLVFPARKGVPSRLSGSAPGSSHSGGPRQSTPRAGVEATGRRGAPPRPADFLVSKRGIIVVAVKWCWHLHINKAVLLHLSTETSKFTAPESKESYEHCLVFKLCSCCVFV